MAKKFYCVKNGRVPGIYTTWSDCQKQVIGFKGAAFKGFETEEEAKAYMGIGKALEKKNECVATAYTDGSFDIKTKRFSMGAVLFYNGETKTFSKAYADDELALMRNVAGEIFASMAVIEYCVNEGIKSLEIVHDYEGVSKWCTGEWKTNKAGTIAYKEYYNSVKDKIDIVFTKVKGHSGNEYNDMADRLAKEALGIA